MADPSSKVEFDDKEKVFTLTSSIDLKSLVAKICIEGKIVITRLQEEEPRLEDAIIKLAKGA